MVTEEMRVVQAQRLYVSQQGFIHRGPWHHEAVEKRFSVAAPVLQVLGRGDTRSRRPGLHEAGAGREQRAQIGEPGAVRKVDFGGAWGAL